MLLKKDQIFAADDIKFEDVDVPEWGGTVRIAMMTAKARDAYEQSMIKVVGKKVEPNTVNGRAKLIAACAVDESGDLLFTAQEVEKLGTKSSAALERLSHVALTINGMTSEAIEGAVKN